MIQKKGQMAGFTLIEVLVASAIAAMVMLMVFQMLSSGLWSMKRGGQAAHMVLVEKQLVTDLSVVDLEAIATGKGVIEGLSYQWKAIEKERSSHYFDILIRYEVEITLSSASGKSQYFLLTQLRKAHIDKS